LSVRAAVLVNEPGVRQDRAHADTGRRSRGIVRRSSAVQCRYARQVKGSARGAGTVDGLPPLPRALAERVGVGGGDGGHGVPDDVHVHVYATTAVGPEPVMAHHPDGDGVAALTLPSRFGSIVDVAHWSAHPKGSAMKKSVVAIGVGAVFALPGTAAGYGPSANPQAVTACETNITKQEDTGITAGGGPKAGVPAPTNCDHFFQSTGVIGNGSPGDGAP
jgi:hypothetical protein